MKKFLIICILGISVSSLVSCGTTEVNQDNIPNKYPIDEYLEKGATLQEYTKSGDALMVDSAGQKFLAAYNSTYKPLLTDDGVLMPLVIVKNTPYYFDYKEVETALPDGYKKARISFFSGNSEKLIGESDIYKFTNSTTAYYNKDDTDTIYVKLEGKNGYQLWKTYDTLATD